MEHFFSDFQSEERKFDLRECQLVKGASKGFQVYYYPPCKLWITVPTSEGLIFRLTKACEA